jgi:hypothetical protein
LLFRRVGVGWSRTMGAESALKAAEAAAESLGWDRPKVQAEVAAYRQHLEAQHTLRRVQA